ncbi:MAG TPA: methyltransferase domain-containing protein [Gemmatimonadales bacterium]|nr:methyltransferase domain-containing protein [Gemmatimonadales bacterium]
MARLRYSLDHWARRPATEENLAVYLRCADTYNLTKVRLFERLLGNDLTGKRVLDYGGGAGFMAVRCAELGAQVTLVDAEPTALETAKLLAAKLGVEDRIRTIYSEEFPRELCEQRFEVVILKDVVEHIPDDEALLRNLASCQDTGDQFLLCTHSTWSLNFLLEGTYKRWWCGEKNWLGWDPTHLRFYTPRSLRRLLHRTGYATRRWSGLYIIPYNILSWFLLGTRHIQLDALHKLDLWFGHLFPFNRLGWNVVVEGVRSSVHRT